MPKVESRPALAGARSVALLWLGAAVLCLTMVQIARADESNTKLCCQKTTECDGCKSVGVYKNNGTEYDKSAYADIGTNSVKRCLKTDSSKDVCYESPPGHTNPPLVPVTTYHGYCYDKDNTKLYSDDKCKTPAGTGYVRFGVNSCKDEQTCKGTVSNNP